MNDLQKLRPNEHLYVPLGSMKPFVNNLEIPKKQLEREKKKVLAENYSSSLPEIVFDQATGNYFVVGGYTTFYAYDELKNSNKLILCKAFYNLAEDERYLLTIDWMMRNKVTNWYNRHEIITILIDNFQYTEIELSTFLIKKTEDIQLYLDPPSNIQEKTTHQGKEKVINKIFLQSFKNGHNKDYLYILLLYFGIHITDEQLKFIRWMRGNGIEFEELQLTLEQEHLLIDKALHLKVDFLAGIRMMINDMQINNGDEPTFKDRLGP